MKQKHKKNTFKTPKKYFEGFTGHLMKRLSGQEARIPKNDGFSIPPSYFDNVQKDIQSTFDLECPRVIKLPSYKKYYLAAASIAALAVLFVALNQNTSEKISFDDVASSDIENYFEDYSSDFSSYEIAEVIPMDEVEISDFMTTTLSDDTILNYLDNNTDEFEELNLEYDEKY